MRDSLKKTITTAVVGVAVALAGVSAQAAEWTWKAQSLWQDGTVNQKAFVRFAANVNKMTNGRLEITPRH